MNNKILSMLDGKPYIETWDEVKDLPWVARQAAHNDFSASTKGVFNGFRTAARKPACWHFLASRFSGNRVDCVGYAGAGFLTNPLVSSAGSVPALRINLPSDISARKVSAEELFGCKTTVGEIKVVEDGEEYTLHTVTFDSIRRPRVKASTSLSKKMKKLLDEGKLEKGEIKYSGNRQEDGTLRQFDTYIYQGKEYAYVEAKRRDRDSDSIYLDGKPVIDEEMIFVEVQPVPFIIRSDWDKLPPCLNPKGTGELTQLVVRQEEAAVAGIPFSAEGSVEYSSDDCDLRHYVENNYVLESFRDDEAESYVSTDNAEIANIKQIFEELKTREIADFVKDSESMNSINASFAEELTKLATLLTEKATSDEEIEKNEKLINSLEEEYKNLVLAKREELQAQQLLKEKRGISLGKMTSSIGELKNFHHDPTQRGERVHKHNPFDNEEQY